MNRRERRAAAKQGKVDLNPTGTATAAAFYEAGLGHMRAGRHLDARLCCQQALGLDPDHADTQHLLGLLSFHARQFDHAVEWISRALKQQPRPQYLTSLGTALLNLGRREDAVRAFDTAVRLKPDDADLWRNLGNVLVDAERPADAILSFQHALALDPSHWDAAFKAGVLLQEAARFEEALTYLNLCNRLQPRHAQTLQRRGLALYGLGRFEDALADARSASALEPADAFSCNNVGTALQSLGRHDEALSWFDRTLALCPNKVETLNNKACSLVELHRFDEAFAVYEQAQRIDPGNALTEWNVALLHMLTGNFEAGWAGREARWNVAALQSTGPARLSRPMWRGEPISGQTILLHSDEGLGDSIQYSRYAPMVAARGARVVLAVEPAIQPLLAGLSGVAECIASGAALPPYDLHCALSSLPLVFKTTLDTIPAATSYLPAVDAERMRAWEQRLGPRTRPRVGLVWTGNPKHRNDHNRSIPLRMLKPILDLDATFVSLQKEPRPADQAVLAERGEIIDLAADLTDFTQTAALACCLDLVITVDTSVAHLAAALGRPTWILLPYTPDYRWLLDREDNPWYPTVRLFRQSATRDYAGVVDRVRAELAALISAGTA
ncbi:tetratricopeptide repeat-containing glycosyltransferase family protein [Bradyrhizobium sp. NP1]|uniref:tetratricopeptide repeat-containing glycosyltransferase family protein n=1 Tax=Bradyrhizobium sp. NP1 TaxID=3049772 RepID=UPI0025A66064|nr:tetratricopeptide repeat-containing glycosyltransferase family protein [Bradyrhizobium sp. NP1]WJR76233.1 tetratricopeptide repeat-containing glycosyltransferase family protein [Bradyrhizobium sp. NP1]